MYKLAFGITLLISIRSLILSTSLLTLLKNIDQIGFGLLIYLIVLTIFSLVTPFYLVFRVYRSWKNKVPLIPLEFIKEQRFGYKLGMLSAWAGTVGVILFFVISAVVFSGVWGKGIAFSGVPLGLTIVFYICAVFSIEVSYFRWSRAQVAA